MHLPSGVRSWTLGEGMSEVLLSFFPPVPGLILDAAESGGRRFAAGTRAAEAPPVLAGDGWGPSLPLLHSHGAAPVAGLADTPCKTSCLSAARSHACCTLTAVLDMTELKRGINAQTQDVNSYCCNTVPMRIVKSLPSFFHSLLQLCKHDVCIWNAFPKESACCPLAAVIKIAITPRCKCFRRFCELCRWDGIKIPQNCRTLNVSESFLKTLNLLL